jgi:hypothetical protein
MSTGNERPWPPRNTANFGFPIPGDTDPADYVSDTGALADAIDAAIAQRLDAMTGRLDAVVERLGAVLPLVIAWAAVNANGTIARSGGSPGLSVWRQQNGQYIISYQNMAVSGIPVVLVSNITGQRIPYFPFIDANGTTVVWSNAPGDVGIDSGFNVLVVGNRASTPPMPTGIESESEPAPVEPPPEPATVEPTSEPTPAPPEPTSEPTPVQTPPEVTP